eukprot:2376418-Rhodomonas_salina.1
MSVPHDGLHHYLAAALFRRCCSSIQHVSTGERIGSVAAYAILVQHVALASHARPVPHTTIRSTSTTIRDARTALRTQSYSTPEPPPYALCQQYHTLCANGTELAMCAQDRTWAYLAAREGDLDRKAEGAAGGGNRVVHATVPCTVVLGDHCADFLSCLGEEDVGGKRRRKGGKRRRRMGRGGGRVGRGGGRVGRGGGRVGRGGGWVGRGR